MAEKGFKRFLPSFITLAFELYEHWRRDAKQSNNIKKLDKTNDKLSTIEHMLVRLEKKIQTNRDLVDRLRFLLLFSWLINVLLVIIILLKVFCLI
ncbi:MAG: hypothetical protein FJ041_03255 [Candidatus Cloacimonetes bacterium]|nr:hypothetical protein [Candidatus Cloacimonadota bacterium]